VLLDAAHNPGGAVATAQAIQDDYNFTRLVGVVSVVADMDARGIVEACERVFAEVVITQANTSRAMAVADLASAAIDVFGEDRVEVVRRLDDALDSAVALAEENSDHLGGSGVLVTGSIYTVAEARTLLGGGSV